VTKGCPDEQIGTCEGCSNKECLDEILASGVCLVHGVKGCNCELVRDEHGYLTTEVRRKGLNDTTRS